MTDQPKHAWSGVETSPVGAIAASQLMQMAGAALIALAALLAYLPSLRGGFLLDDDQLVTDSPIVQRSDGLYRFWFTTEPVDYWPLTNTSFWIEWRLWGANPTGYRVTNLLLHIASSILIWTVLSQLGIPGAWLAALLFAVHPVNVESVAWIAQRKNTLSMLFFMLSILWYLKDDTPARWAWYWLSLLAFTLAMLSKGSVAMLPVVLLLLTWWQRGSVAKRDLMLTAPFFLVAVVLTAVNIWFQGHGSADSIRDVTILQRLLGAGAVVWFYLYKALAPVNLAFIYPQWNIQPSDWRWWVPLAAAIAVTGLLVWQRNGRFGRPLLFAWLLFCIALVPVMGFADVGFMKHSLVADHYQYIAIIGVVALAAAGLTLWRQRLQGSIRLEALVATVALIAALTLISWRQSTLYADPVTLYRDALLKNPDSFLLHNNLGSVLTNRGLHEGAVEQYQAALHLKPDFPQAYYNLGKSLIVCGRSQEAIESLQQALNLKADYPEAHDLLGLAYANASQPQQAIEHFDQALKLKPDYPGAHNNLGIELAKTGRPQEAIDHYQEALRLKPNYPEALNNLGSALKQLGRFDEAAEACRQALSIRPGYPEARANLATIYAKMDRPAEALENCQQALRLRPDYPEAYAILATILAKMDRPDEALASAQRALDLARSSNQSALAEQMEAWLAAYRAHLSTDDRESPQSNADAPP